MIGTRGFSLTLCVHVLELARHRKWDLILEEGKQDVSIVHEKKIGPSDSRIPLDALRWVGR